MLPLIAILLSYLLGGIPSGLLIARAFGVADIRQHGSGNIGATNVWRIAGGKAAFWVYLADISKGILAVFLGEAFIDLANSSVLPYDTLLVACAMAAVLGNVFPVYLNFKGGKGVNTALGGVLTLLPVETLISLLAFLVTVLIFRYISAGSIAGALVLLSVLLIERFMMNIPIADIYLYLAFLLTVLIVFTHRKNVGRILTGTENRFSFHGSKKAGQNA